MDAVRITDVSPRDGLQNEPVHVPPADKARLCELLIASGVDEVEVTSFVSPKWVPQLGDAAHVCELLTHAPQPACLLSALAPNEAGMNNLLLANQQAGRTLLRKVSVFSAASETFCRKNTNASIDESLARFRPILAAARREGLLVRGYISCVFACPFEGAIAPGAVHRVVDGLLNLGVDEIDLGDTIGAGTPERTRALLRELRDVLRLPPPAPGEHALTLHLHDTFGQAGACVREAIDKGVRSFDGAVAGLGGCPYASTATTRAPGNIATELLVSIAREMGLRCAVDAGTLREAAAHARQITGKTG